MALRRHLLSFKSYFHFRFGGFGSQQGRLSLYPGGAVAPPPKLGGGKEILGLFGRLGGRAKIIGNAMLRLVDRGDK